MKLTVVKALEVSGIKPHIALDAQGLEWVQSLLAGSGYTGEPLAQGVRQILEEQMTVQIAKRNEWHSVKGHAQTPSGRA